MLPSCYICLGASYDLQSGHFFLWEKRPEENCPGALLEGHRCCTFYNNNSSKNPGRQPLWSCYTTIPNQSVWCNPQCIGSLPTTEIDFSQMWVWEIHQYVPAVLITGKNPPPRWLFAVISEGGWGKAASSVLCFKGPNPAQEIPTPGPTLVLRPHILIS